MPNDRRTEKTQRAIMDSLCDLIVDEKFEKITVKDIADRADVSRKTFYSYYNDKYDLMSSIEEKFINQFKTTLYNNDFDNLLQKKDTFLKTILGYIEENEKYCFAITRFCNSAYLFRQIEITAIQYIRDNAEAELIDKERLEVVVTFYMSGLIGVLEKYFNCEISISYEEMSHVLHELYSSSFGVIFKKDPPQQ